MIPHTVTVSMAGAQMSLNERFNGAKGVERFAKRYTPYFFWGVTVQMLRKCCCAAKTEAGVVQIESERELMLTPIRKLSVGPANVACPFCKVGIGKRCKTSGGIGLRSDSLGAVLVHVARIKKASQTTAKRKRQTHG